MANYTAAARLRAALATGLPRHVPTLWPTREQHPPFSDADWQYSQRLREACDRQALVRRWVVLCQPSDGIVRRYYLTGSYASVCARASAFFPNGTALVWPADAQDGEELIDHRLSLGITTTT